MTTKTLDIHARTGLTGRQASLHFLPEQDAAAALGVGLRSLLRDVRTLHRADRNGLVIYATVCGRTMVVSFNDRHFDAALVTGELTWITGRLDPADERRENARIAAEAGVVNPVHLAHVAQARAARQGETIAA